MCYFVTELAAVVSDNGGAYPMNFKWMFVFSILLFLLRFVVFSLLPVWL
jgi:hypothetical protein